MIVKKGKKGTNRLIYVLSDACDKSNMSKIKIVKYK